MRFEELEIGDIFHVGIALWRTYYIKYDSFKALDISDCFGTLHDATGCDVVKLGKIKTFTDTLDKVFKEK